MISKELELAIKESVQTASKEVFKETDKKIKRMTEAVDALTGKWGKFVESIVAPGAEKMFKERGIEVEQIYTRAESHKNGDVMEIDILITNGEYVVLISVKSTLKIENVNEHIEDLKRFKEFFPRYKDAKIIGAVAGIVMEENADKYAYHKGLFVIAPKGEMVRILNDKKFKPKVW